MTSGFLNVMKPAGMTSHAVVARVRRLTGIRQIGHAGTLDPDAVGVLPLAVGQFTRLLPYANLTPKIYRAQVRLNTLTDTGDAAGRVVARSTPIEISIEAVIAASRWLQGQRLWQVPPQVSALKHQGQRQYAMLRHQPVVWPVPRLVSILSIEQIVPIVGGFEFVAVVGPGTYIRALVRDWGYLLGKAAHLAFLRREQVGMFGQSDAYSLERLEALGAGWTTALVSDQNYLNPDRIEVREDLTERIRHGDPFGLSQLMGHNPGAKALTFNGKLLAIVTGPPWRYRVVLKEG